MAGAPVASVSTPACSVCETVAVKPVNATNRPGGSGRTLEHVEVLVALDRPRAKVAQPPLRTGSVQQPFRRQECRSPIGVDDSVIALFAELGRVPVPLGVQGVSDLFELGVGADSLAGSVVDAGQS